MLSFEENGWNFKALKIQSVLNLLPLEIDMKTGKIRTQLSKIRTFIFQMIFCLAISHWLFMFWRLVESTLVDPEKYFRWDHFILHCPLAVDYSLTYFMGFCLFVQNPAEGVVIWNELFVEEETGNAVLKMMEQEQEQDEEEQEGKFQIKSGPRESKKKGSVSAAEFPEGADPDGKIRKKSKKSSCGVSRGRPPRPLLTWPPQYSVDEMAAKTFSLIMADTVFFTTIIYAADLNRPQHLYSILPPEYQNWSSFLGLLAVEAFFLTFMFGLAHFSLISQMLFFSKCQAKFKQLDLQLRNLKEKLQSRPIESREIRKEMWILRQASKEMKKLALFLKIFNRCFPPCIFAMKLDFMVLAVLFYFFSIRHGGEFPLLAGYTGYCATFVTLYYGILYEKAFSIPEKMERLKNNFLLSAQKTKLTSTPENTNGNGNGNGNNWFWAEMKREIGGIRDVGVKVASFHTLERQSTPNFINFVVNQVVSLLVTFPR